MLQGYLSIYRVRMDDAGNLRISPVMKDDQGRYQCRASNLAASRETKPVRLRVLGEKSFTYVLWLMLHNTNTNLHYKREQYLSASLTKMK